MEDFDWEWFKDDGYLVVVTLVITAFLLWAMQHWVPRWITKIISRLAPKGDDWSQAARTTRRIIYWVGSLLIVGVATIIILPLVGVEIDRVTNELEDIGRGFLDWLRGSGVRVVLTFVVAYAITKLVHQIIPRAIRGAVVRSETKRDRLVEEAEQRAETLSSFLTGTAVVITWVVAVFIILPEFDVNIAPLLAGAGVMGIGIGFGAQGLVRDVLSGIFILMEDQYAKGDWVALSGIQGEVESLGLRRTVLRDFDGTHHTIPNGNITIASNYSKDWACVNLDIVVGYGEDLERVTEIMNRISKNVAAEDAWKGFIIGDPPKVLYVSYLGDSGISLKLWGKTKPSWQWAVTGELRKRIKMAFDAEGIEIPWPHIKLYFGDKPPSIMGVKKEGGEDQDV
jgi:small conductance mechanosensitive channel